MEESLPFSKVRASPLLLVVAGADAPNAVRRARCVTNPVFCSPLVDAQIDDDRPVLPAPHLRVLLAATERVVDVLVVGHLVAADEAVGRRARHRVRLAREVMPGLVGVRIVGGEREVHVNGGLELLAAAQEGLALVVRASDGDGPRRHAERPDAPGHALADDLGDPRGLDGGLARVGLARVPDVPQRLVALVHAVRLIARDVLVVLAERLAVIRQRQRRAAGGDELGQEILLGALLRLLGLVVGARGRAHSEDQGDVEGGPL